MQPEYSCLELTVLPLALFVIREVAGPTLKQLLPIGGKHIILILLLKREGLKAHYIFEPFIEKISGYNKI